MMIILIVVLSVLYAEGAILNLTEGSECVRHGLKGKCVGAKSCESFNLVDVPKRNVHFEDICTYNNIEAVICCVDCEPFTRDYRDSAITGDKYIWKNGNKSWDKCVEFLNLKEYRCKENRIQDQKKIYDPKKKCITTQGFTTGVSLAAFQYRDSVAHIAMLEYGEEKIKTEKSQSKEPKVTETTESLRDESSTTETQTTEMSSVETTMLKQWVCAGSLISNRFVLTVAQCGTMDNRGPVTYVLLGTGRRPHASLEDQARYKVKRFIPHPEYKPPSLYNDIALIETVTQVVFTATIVPICLVYDSSADENIGLLLSWGSDDYRAEGNTDSYIYVQKFNPARCSFRYANDLPKGVNATSQACYKDPGREESCQSIPGIPFEVENGVVCTRFIAALTSYNRSCGVNGGVGLYTRVLPFIPWIENIVWPEV